MAGKRSVDRGRRVEIGLERRARTRAKIIAAAFERFGSENGLFTRIEDIAADAGITRTTFYNHFSGMEELREASSYELTHDFLVGVSEAVDKIPDLAHRAAAAPRLYIERARRDRQWAWSMINVSASGFFFGVETHQRAQRTIQEGIDAGVFALRDSALGRDIVLGIGLAAISTQIREKTPPDFPAEVATHILLGLGLTSGDAREIASRPLPKL